MRIVGIAILMLVISGCSEGKPKNVGDVHHSIVSATEENTPAGVDVLITINHRGSFEQSLWLASFGSASESILSAIAKYWPGKYASVTVSANADTYDKLGTQAWMPALSIRFEGDAMRANYKNLGPWGTVNNWAQPLRISQIGIRALAAGCSDNEQAQQYYADFCRRALVVLRQTAQ